jgi:hypothetical protein
VLPTRSEGENPTVWFLVAFAGFILYSAIYFYTQQKTSQKTI